MRVDEHIAAMRREGERMAAALERADLDAVVPTCPDWTVREVAQHVGRVQRWAAAHVLQAREEQLSPAEAELAWGEMPADHALVGWFRTGHAALVEALGSAPEDLVCWTFLPAPSPLAFWARRQAHELAVHAIDVAGVAIARVDVAGVATARVDVAGVATARANVAGVDGALPSDFAVDGVDELLLCFFSRVRNRLRTPDSRTLAVTATDTGDGWLVHMGPDGARCERGEGAADAHVLGSAAELYVGLWNRGPLAVAQGDAALLDLWRDRATVRWS